MAVQERLDGFRTVMDELRADPEFRADLVMPRFPLTLGVGYHDGPGAQLYDPDGKPVIFDLLRDEEQAVQLEWLLNTLAKRAGLMVE